MRSKTKLKKVLFVGVILLSLISTMFYIRILFYPRKETTKIVSEGGRPHSINLETRGLSLWMEMQNNNSSEKLTTSETHFQQNKNPKTQQVKRLQKTTREKVVLFYTGVFGVKPWHGLKSTYDLIHYEGKVCEVSNCRLTYDHNELARSDAVIFHAYDIPSVSHMKEISKNPNRWNQRWIYFNHENPYYTPHNAASYNGLFNWTMSYRRDSEFFNPYYYYRPLNSTEKRMQEGKKRKNYAQGKDKLSAAWIVSNCRRYRDNVVKKLIVYNIHVTVFGKCSLNFNQSNSCLRNSIACVNLLKRFKFYLAFENANCIDYVTEKYWSTPFLSDMVPVVLGPPKYDSKIAIPGSYINVQDFPSIKDLASYLEYLDKNDTAYNVYFEWRNRFIKLDYSTPWNCQMCADLNNPNLPVKVYDDLGTYWGKRSSCVEFEDKVYKQLEV